MGIDESTERVIPLPREQVAAYAMDWRHDAEWTHGIREATLTREADGGGFGAGAEVTRNAYFPGKRIDYVLRVAAYDPPGLLDMVPVACPMSMHVTYTFAPRPGGTPDRIRVRGDTAGFYRPAPSLMGRKVRPSLVKDPAGPGTETDPVPLTSTIRRAVMAYDEGLAERIRDRLGTDPAVTEKRMFGGLAFLHTGNMAVGVIGDELMVRVGPDATDAALARPGTRPFDFTGRPMRGWVVVDASALSEDSDLDHWIEQGHAFASGLPPK